MTVCMVYHQSPVEELIRRCELAEYWLVVVKRELIRRTVHGLDTAVSTACMDSTYHYNERIVKWEKMGDSDILSTFPHC